MKAGNEEYIDSKDLPESIPVFPLSGALLLPNGNMPLNIFEKRYMNMIDDAMIDQKLIGMIQPDLKGEKDDHGPLLCKVGCLGRITGFQESGDGRYLINLSGICRFEIKQVSDHENGYRLADIHVDNNEFSDQDNDQEIDRENLLATFRKYLETNQMETDWEEVERTDNQTLVTALCMMSPYGPAEKQALLEASDLRTRTETLIAITEIELAKNSDEPGSVLQ